MFKHAIVRKIGKSFVNGLTTSDLGNPDYEKALVQHEAYIEALKRCGVKVTVLESDETYPDSTFVEDTAVLTSKCALVTNPGADSRNGEIIEMKEILKDFYDTIEYIQSPGMLDGGDVMQAEDRFYVGLSSRTNEAGARQFKDIMGKYGYDTTIIPLKKFFHLKTGVNYLGDNNLLVAGEFINHEAFSSYNQIVVTEDEEYSGNCVRMNDYIIVPKGFEGTKKKIEDIGYTVIEVEMSEFQKQDGGLSCLSLRF